MCPRVRIRSRPRAVFSSPVFQNGSECGFRIETVSRYQKYTVKCLCLSWLFNVPVFTMSHIFKIFSLADACPFNFHGYTDFLHDFRIPA